LKTQFSEKEQDMSALLRKICGCVVAITALALLAGTLVNWGCSKKDDVSQGSSYSVEYKIATMSGSDTVVEAVVKGPAAKLVVILTDPKGILSDVQKVEKEEMIITNPQTVKVLMRNPQAGTWILTVKTVEPEKVVWQKKITFSPAMVEQNSP
jgi:hypothetical protein